MGKSEGPVRVALKVQNTDLYRRYVIIVKGMWSPAEVKNLIAAVPKALVMIEALRSRFEIEIFLITSHTAAPVYDSSSWTEVTSRRER